MGAVFFIRASYAATRDARALAAPHPPEQPRGLPANRTCRPAARSYRRAIVKIAGVSHEAELTFTTTKIEHNFSNYSAWHYRSGANPMPSP